MLFRPPSKTKPRTSQMAGFAAPTAGWISNRNLATPKDGMQGAEVLENFFPTATSAVLRRGSLLYATLGSDGLTTKSLFTYINGTTERMFGATDEAIYDITTILSAYNYTLVDHLNQALESDQSDTFGQNSTEGLDVMSGLHGGEWSTVQFATAGGVFLIGVNGEDPGFVFDGSAFYPQAPDGAFVMSFGVETQAFVPGEIVTGVTSGTTAIVHEVVEGGTPGQGALVLTGITGTFNGTENLTGSLGGAAISASLPTLVAPGITFPAGSGRTMADMCYVWNYKQRLYFLPKNSLSVWYLPVDQIAGELTELPLAGVFPSGGHLVFGQTWSLDAGAQGGLSEQCVFITSQGEVAVYQGLWPEDADWRKTGIYQIGEPLGPKAWIRGGGDLVIATNIGKVPLSQAIQRDVAALAPAAVSYPIEVAWNEACANRGKGWHCVLWSEGQMMAVSPPPSIDDEPVVFVANARTGAWGKFTGWDVRCFCTFRGKLYFGSTGGKVVQAYETGLDENRPYTGKYVPLFEDMGSPASLKIAELARHTVRAVSALNEVVACQIDFGTTLPSPPDATLTPVGNQWNVAIWDQSIWSGRQDAVVNHRLHSVGGAGYTLAPSLQITSGAIVPLDAEIIRSELTFQVAGFVS